MNARAHYVLILVTAFSTTVAAETFKVKDRASCALHLTAVPAQTAGVLKINTSNPGKRREFARLFASNGRTLEFTGEDLSEIDADPLLVIAHKASQFDGSQRILVEDTMLSIEGADIGVNIRWLLDSAATMVGRRATWTVHLAYRERDQVRIYKGEIHGRIVPARSRGEGFGAGFDPIFMPDGATQTLGEDKPDQFNARALAISALLNDQNALVRPALVEWHGKWQNAH